MPARINIPEDALDDMKAIASIPVPKAASALAALDAAGKVLSMDEVSALLREHIGELSGAMLRQLVSIQLLVNRHKFGTSSEALAAITRTVKEDEEINASFPAWDQLRPTFEALMQQRSIRAIAKAIDLGLEQPHRLTGTRIITDIRPIFMDEIGVTDPQIGAALIVQSLRLSYFDDGDSKEIILSLDEQRLSELQRDCERALAKSKAARVRLAQAQWPVLDISGDSDDE